MASRNNLHNRAVRAGILRDVELALRCFYRGESDRAELFLKQAKEGFSQVRFGRGRGWDDAHNRYSQARTIMHGPCACWYCTLTLEQKQEVKEQVSRKVADLSCIYADVDNNFTGAYAEVVFGIRFGLRINQIPGFDGGRDFTIPCIRAISGELTIDVKGTTYGELSGVMLTCNFPYQPNWKQSANHIYVLLHVIDRKHAFFRGFAFGNDKARLQSSFVGASHRRWRAPMPSRDLQELEELIANRPGFPLLDNIEVEGQPDSRFATTRIVAVNPKQPSAKIDGNAPSRGNTEGVGLDHIEIILVVPDGGIDRRLHRHEVETAPAAKFLEGMSVRHPHYGLGTVLDRGVPRFLRTLGCWDEHVTIQFADISRTVAANLGGLIVDWRTGCLRSDAEEASVK